MNRFFTLLLAASCLTAVGQVPDYVPTDGLIGWWALDGNAVCEIDGIDDGAVLGPTATENRFGVQASAFSFDGNDMLEIYDQTELRPESFTVSIWAWIDAANGQIQQLVAKNAGNGPFESVDVVVRSDNSLMGNIGGPDFWGTWIYDSSNEFPPGQWNHVVYSFDDSLNHQSLYQNGVLIASGGVFDSIEYDSLPWTLGAEREGGVFSWWLIGKLDDFGLWNRALSSAEVSELFNWTPFGGCTNPTACNFNAEAQVDDGSCISAGCTDSYACNFHADAACDDGSCDYSCCPGPGCCLDGQHWDWDLSGCVITNPADINLDGCVQLNDLLDLLTAYGNCAAEESPWQCGDPLEYQGYEYETVQIGEQCWFAENLRAENYRNGESIVYSGSASDWETNGYTAQGCRAAYNDDPMLGAFWGYIYNGFAVNDERALCPTGWIVPKNADWLELGEFLGGMNVAGQKMKNSPNDEFAWNGDNSSGFGGYATGDRHWPDGSFNHALDGSVGDSEVVIGLYWSGAPGSIPAQNYYALYEMDDELTQSSSNGPPLGFGAAVRCIKDAE